MKIVHIISGLGVGGAEVLLLNLVLESRSTGNSHVIISLSGLDTIADRFRAAGAEVEFLGMRSGIPDPRLLLRLAKWIADAKPDIVQTWMYHADIFGGIAAWLARLAFRIRGARQKFALVWGVHRTEVPSAKLGGVIRLLARVGAVASNWAPDVIVCCANAAFKSHADHGYERSKMRVIHNGFDVHRFVPDLAAKTALLNSLDLPSQSILIGIVGRYNPAKDYDNFLQAAAQLRERVPACRFVMVGKDVDAHNTALARSVAELGLADVCHLMGPRSNLHEIMPAFDILCLSSRTEGLPTVVGEAMACGVPCVVTDVGDTGELVGDTGFVVPARDPARLAAALEEMASLSQEQRKTLGTLARKRIVESFSIAICWQKYREMYAALLGSKSAAR